MKAGRLFKWAGWGLLALVAVLLLATGAGYLWLRSSLPRTEGTLTLAGLEAPVELRRDRHGIVHIRARNEADGYFALGFAHAQDRLFQMDFMRRAGAGRLSEAIGEATLGLDRTMRVLGLYRAARANLPLLAPEVRAALAAYSAGVNAFLEAHSGTLPPEFHLLGYRPEPWQPVDSLVWGRVMALHLSNNWREELLRARLALQLSPEQLEFIWPALPANSDRVAAEGAAPARPADGRSVTVQALLERLAGTSAALPRDLGASNSWAVSGQLTASGKPLLANDPHLGLTAPIQWYLARIETPTLTISGGTAPGVPFTLIGHNGRLAWGFTTTHSDTQDLFVEKLAPGDPARYMTPEGSEPFDTREEVIRVRGAPDEVLTVRTTRHGPVVSDIGMAAAAAGAEDRVVALAWPGLRADDMTAQAMYRMNRAGDVDAFRSALRDFHSPQQNVVYADHAGEIGFVAAGRVPVRKALSAGGQMPASGWTGDHDWTGFLPFEALPQLFNPAAGWIATANSDVTPEDYPHFLAARWEEPYRAERIAELLEDGVDLTADDMAAMQLDTLSRAARVMLPRMVAAAESGGSRHRDVLERMRRWDFRVDRDRPEPLIFLTWLRESARRIFADEFGPFYFEYWSWNLDQVGSVLAADPAGARWCDDVDSPAAEACPAQVAAALEEALESLAAAYGDASADWRWGDAHQAHFPHPVLEHVPVIGEWLEASIETDGDNATVNRGTPRISPDLVVFPHIHGAGLRAIFDFADLDRSRFIIATGQSGNPLSRHYTDQVRRWRDGTFLTLTGEAREILILQPETR